MARKEDGLGVKRSRLAARALLVGLGSLTLLLFALPAIELMRPRTLEVSSGAIREGFISSGNCGKGLHWRVELDTERTVKVVVPNEIGSGRTGRRVLLEHTESLIYHRRCYVFRQFLDG